MMCLSVSNSIQPSSRPNGIDDESDGNDKLASLAQNLGAIRTRREALAQNALRFSETIMLKPNLGEGYGGAQRDFFSNPADQPWPFMTSLGADCTCRKPKRRRGGGANSGAAKLT